MTVLARVVFALLVLASFAAFFVAQRLKHSPAIVQRFMATPSFSPGSSGRRRLERISFRLRQADDVTVTVVDARQGAVATLARGRFLDAYTQLSLQWDGRTDRGLPAPAGSYQIRVSLRRQARSVLLPRTFALVPAARASP